MKHPSSLAVAVVLVAALGSAGIATAGPPLICHPFVTDAAAVLLPWTQGKDWRSPDPSYDTRGLVADTLGLLTDDAPLLARMENMRRAAIYADGHPELAAALLRAALERTETPPADARAEALGWFDAGYLVETYRQLGLIYAHGMAKGHWTPLLPPDLAELDGKALVHKAHALAPEAKAELDFALYLITWDAPYRDRALAGAVPGSVLAQNLSVYDR